MTIESSRSSSSSSSFQILSPCCSPSASISTAARSGPGELARGLLLGLAAGQRRDQVGDLVRLVPVVLGLLAWLSHGVDQAALSWSQVRMMATVSFGLRVGQLADLLHRLGVHLALHLGDVDHLGGVAGHAP